MIVRIAGEGRWHLDDRLAPDLHRDELRLKRAVDEQHEHDYRSTLDTLSGFVRTHGHALSNILGAASITIPSPRMTLAEARELLAGSATPASDQTAT